MLLMLLAGAAAAQPTQPPAEPAAAPAAEAPPAPPAPQTAQPRTPPSVPGTPSPAKPAADLAGLIATLEDPAARDALLAKLKALESSGAPEPAKGAFGEAIDTFNETIEARVETVGEAFAGVVGSVRQVPILLRWVWLQLNEPISRALWWSVAVETGVAVLAGFLASVMLVRLPLRGWRDRLGTLPLAATTKARAKASLAHLVVNLLALAVFLVVTYAVLAYGDTTPLARLIAGDVLVAIGGVRGLTAISKALLAPENPRRRMPAIDDALAHRAQWWLSFLLGLGVYGSCALTAAERLGLPWTVHAFLRHLLFLVVTVLVVVQIYRWRGEVAALVEHWGRSSKSAVTRYLPWEALAASGHHVIAAWVALVFLVWAVGVQGGAVLLSRGLVVSVAAVLLLRAFHVWLDWTLMPRPAGTGEDGAEPESEAEPRPASRVAVIAALRLAAGLLALAIVLEAWGVDVAGWLQSSNARAILASIGRIGAVIAIVAVVARVVQAAAARYVEAVGEGDRPLYSSRTRTLVSLARNLVLLLLVAVGVVQVLSELGVNANALLAGAGVVGLALGFGSQKLVQDLINGMFVLLGDTVRVGDVVDLTGKAGVVEAISMRTITLRDYNGNVHTIPYSSIDVVTNMTKDFSFAVFDVRVAYKEDVDKVMEVLRGIDSQLRREWPYRRIMLEPLEIAGLDQFFESSVLVKARSKVRAGEQWKVLREFNRRIKQRFDELGIEIPFPHQTVYFGADEHGEAPPQHIEQLRRQLVPEEAAPPRRAVGEG